MMIQSISIDENTFNEMGVGLPELPLDKPLEMRALGRIVVLAGPNGAGKSRLLRLIEKLVSKQLNAQTVEKIKHDIRQHAAPLPAWSAELIRLNNQLAKSSDQATIDAIRQTETNLANFKGNINQFELQLRSSSVLKVDGDELPRIVSFVPKQPKLVDPIHTTAAEANHRADRLSHNTAAAETNAPAYAQRVMRLAVESGYERQGKGLQGNTPAEVDRDKLIDIVGMLLGAEVILGLKNSHLTIGKIDSYAEALSPGQQVLFQFACLLHAQQASLADCIVMMDEPENHLHPAVLAQVVETLREHLSSGQLWIATHSVPLIAQLMSSDNDCLWFVNDGKVKRSGRSPETVLDSLMGGPDGSKHLHNLTLLPAQYAGVRFLSECLEAPCVVGPDVKDPQTRQISEIVQKKALAKKASSKPLRILDFGAGKGRLLATLRSDDSDTKSWLDYYAYDLDSTFQNDCELEIVATYGNDTNPRWFSDLHVLGAQVDKESVDVVVLCNVLHEIDPDDWLKLFAEGSVLQNLICNDGFLLVVEDYGIPVGERAHRYGFLLLDMPELCELFVITAEDRKNNLYISQTSQDSRYSERLKAHLIGKTCVSRMTSETRKIAIQKLRDRMLDGVSAYLRNGLASDGADGRTYARSAQLLANASSWLSER